MKLDQFELLLNRVIDNCTSISRRSNGSPSISDEELLTCKSLQGSAIDVPNVDVSTDVGRPLSSLFDVGCLEFRRYKISTFNRTTYTNDNNKKVGVICLNYLFTP